VRAFDRFLGGRTADVRLPCDRTGQCWPSISGRSLRLLDFLCIQAMDGRPSPTMTIVKQAFAYRDDCETGFRLPWRL
jgi:hypothetical protein